MAAALTAMCSTRERECVCVCVGGGIHSHVSVTCGLPMQIAKLKEFIQESPELQNVNAPLPMDPGS